MGSLRISRVSYEGDKYSFHSPELNRPVSIIEGPNGSGKSTFFNLIHYCLGGKVEEFDSSSQNKHAEVCGDQNNFVTLVVIINKTRYALVRKIGDNQITVRPSHAEEESLQTVEINTYPIFRRENNTTFSDWLLAELSIPVVEIYQGGRSFKLNFSDLSRLIYHNQAPDPHGIYKPADSSSFVSDSLEIRRAIFQIFVGKTLLSLYEAIGTFKRAERSFDTAKAILREYQHIVGEVLKEQQTGGTVQNARFLADEIAAIDEQLDKLVRSRNHRAVQRPTPGELLHGLDADKNDLSYWNTSLRQADDEIATATRDKLRLLDVSRSISEDIDRVGKVVFTHEQLQLFSSDTCPYCLNAVTRHAGKCVCGTAVDENDYQRFFYSATEYIDIYRAKKKSFDTVQVAIFDLDSDLSKLIIAREHIISNIQELTLKIDTAYTLSDKELNDAQLDQFNEKIFELRATQNELIQALKMEQKIGFLQSKYDSQKDIFDSAKTAVEQLHLASREELRLRLREFSSIYNEFMTAVLSGCRVARIDADTYMPVINDGEYREASADVPKRFLYYLTLLLLSLREDIPFPRLLLIDTPETAGIDKPNLVRMLRQISSLDKTSTDYQIILSTGEDKYPPEFRPFVVAVLSDDSKLLRAKVLISE